MGADQLASACPAATGARLQPLKARRGRRVERSSAEGPRACPPRAIPWGWLWNVCFLRCGSWMCSGGDGVCPPGVAAQTSKSIFRKTHSRCGVQKQCLRADLWDFCAPLRQRARGGLWQRYGVDDHFNVQCSNVCFTLKASSSHFKSITESERDPPSGRAWRCTSSRTRWGWTTTTE